MIITPATHQHKGHADTARRVGQRKGHLPRCKTLSKWKSFLDFNPETRVFLLCWPFQASPLYPTAKMSCRKRCKREIFKFAQYLFRLITGTLNTGKTLTGVFAAVLLNLRRFLYLHLSSFVLLLLNVFIIFFFFLQSPNWTHPPCVTSGPCSIYIVYTFTAAKPTWGFPDWGLDLSPALHHNLFDCARMLKCAQKDRI